MPKLRHIYLAAAIAASALFSGCGDEKPDENGKGKKPPPKAPAAKPELPEPTDELSKSVEAFTGGHTKLVWAAHQNKKSADTYMSGQSHFLAGLDTRDGKGIRFIIEERSNYARPMVTPSGSRIVYTFNDITKKDNGIKHYKPTVCIVNWDGSGKTELGEGYATDVWRDPSGKDWVYAVRNIQPDNRAQIKAKELIRFPLNEPEKIEVVWKRTKLSADNTQLSRDGKWASGLFPWPDVGVMNLEKMEWKRLELGCWPSHVPDDSRISWVFDGAHQIVSMFRGDERWKVKLNEHPDFPDLKGAEMYHPRWSNHPRYIALTGPYRGAKSGNSISKGGLGAEVFLAKFDPEIKKVEGFVQITENSTGDFFPDLWIAGGEEESLELPPIDLEENPAPVAETKWPGAGAVFGWKNLEDENEIQIGEENIACKVEAKGFARFGRLFDLLVDGGHFTAGNESKGGILEAAKQKKVSFSALFTAPTGEESTVLLGTPNLIVLRDKEGTLSVLHKAEGVEQHFQWDFPSALPSDKSHHIAVAIEGDAATAWIDGESLSPVDPKTATLEESMAWDGVVLGANGGGRLEQVAIFNATIQSEHVSDLAKKAREMIDNRPAAPARIRIKGKLAKTEPVPTFEEVKPYRECLMNVIYEVEEVVEGKYELDEILVQHWGLMDENPVPGWPREVGKTYEIIVEERAAHPELEGARRLDKIQVFHLPVYYDVKTPGGESKDE